MSRALSYADAVRVLNGAAPNKVVTTLDRLAGGALLALSATGSTLALGPTRKCCRKRPVWTGGERVPQQTAERSDK